MHMTAKGLILGRKCTTDHGEQWCEGWLPKHIYILRSLHTLHPVEQFITEHVISTAATSETGTECRQCQCEGGLAVRKGSQGLCCISLVSLFTDCTN